MRCVLLDVFGHLVLCEHAEGITSSVPTSSKVQRWKSMSTSPRNPYGLTVLAVHSLINRIYVVPQLSPDPMPAEYQQKSISKINLRLCRSLWPHFMVQDDLCAHPGHAGSTACRRFWPLHSTIQNSSISCMCCSHVFSRSACLSLHTYFEEGNRS